MEEEKQRIEELEKGRRGEDIIPIRSCISS